MKLLERFLFFNFIKILVGSLLFFSIITLFVEFVSYVEELLKKDVFWLGAQYHAMRIPITMYTIFPITVMFSSVYVLGDMVKHKEIISVYNAGVSTLDFIKKLIVFVFILSIGFIFFREYIAAPLAQDADEIKQTWRRRVERRTKNYNVTVFGQRRLLHTAKMYDMTEKKLYSVVMIKRGENNEVLQRLTAKTAHWNSETEDWTFNEGYFTMFDESGEVEKVTGFKATNYPMEELPYYFDVEEQDFTLMTIRENYRHLQKMRSINGSIAESETELHFKMSTAVISFILVILAAVFARFSTQSVLVVSFALVIAFTLVFYIFIFIGTSAAKAGFVPPVVGAWAANVFFTLLSVFLFYRYNG